MKLILNKILSIKFAILFTLIALSTALVYSANWPLPEKDSSGRETEITDIYSSYRDGEFHRGVDCAASSGTLVYPVADGVVEKKGTGTIFMSF